MEKHFKEKIWKKLNFSLEELFEQTKLTKLQQDGVIELPTFEMGITSGDIFFEFRTSLERPMVLLHSVGDNGDFIKVGYLTLSSEATL